MHDEMFGHLLAAMRFGADEAACRAAIDVAFRCAQQVTLTLARTCRDVHVPDNTLRAQVI